MKLPRPMDRRGALKLLATVGVTAPALGCIRRPQKREPAIDVHISRQGARRPGPPASGRHAQHLPGARLADPARRTARGCAELNGWARALPRPKAVLMLSAHWLDRPVTLGATTTVPLVYDFSGFPPEFYRTKYPAPGAPALAARVRELLGPRPAGRRARPRAWTTARTCRSWRCTPTPTCPCCRCRCPASSPQELLALGRALAPLRDEGVLIIGSGFLTHNLRAHELRSERAHAARGRADFDAWTADALARRDVDALWTTAQKAPGVRESLPTHEHFVPVIVALGAALDDAPAVTFPITGWAYGSGTKRSVQFG